MELAIVTVCAACRRGVSAIEVAIHQLQARRDVRRRKEGTTGFLDHTPEHGLRLVDSIRRCLRARIADVDRHVVAIGRPLDNPEVGERRACISRAIGTNPSLTSRMAARPATPPRRVVSARIADRTICARAFSGHHRRSTDGLLLERRPGLVGSRASLERCDRRADLRAIVGQPDGRQGIERLEDDDQIVGSKLRDRHTS